MCDTMLYDVGRPPGQLWPRYCGFCGRFNSFPVPTLQIWFIFIVMTGPSLRIYEFYFGRAQCPLPGKYLLLLDWVDGNSFGRPFSSGGGVGNGYILRLRDAHDTLPSSPSWAAVVTLQLDSLIGCAIKQMTKQCATKSTVPLEWKSAKRFLMPFKIVRISDCWASLRETSPHARDSPCRFRHVIHCSLSHAPAFPQSIQAYKVYGSSRVWWIRALENRKNRKTNLQ